MSENEERSEKWLVFDLKAFTDKRWAIIAGCYHFVRQHYQFSTRRATYFTSPPYHHQAKCSDEFYYFYQTKVNKRSLIKKTKQQHLTVETNHWNITARSNLQFKQHLPHIVFLSLTRRHNGEIKHNDSTFTKSLKPGQFGFWLDWNSFSITAGLY